jgi:predicted nucleic acid-binding protein
VKGPLEIEGPLRRSGRTLHEELLPDGSAISVITLAELQAGVLAARDTQTRARRLATLDALSDIQVLDVDAGSALVWAQMRVELAEAGRRVNVNDLWIAASAVRHGLPVVTHDDDFSAVEGIAGLAVIRV